MVDRVKPQATDERRLRIRELLMDQGAVRVQALSDLFMVSEVTIRNDLDVMARDGQLRRHRGGAVAASPPNLSIAFDQRASLNLEKKRQIGRAAAHLVDAEDTIIMDSGTTLAEMAKSLNTSDPFTVVTNALNVASQVGALPNALVILTGGTLNRETISTFGPQTERSLSDHVVRKAFLGIQAIEPELGLTDTSIEIAHVKQAMIRAARRVILLADSSKWRRAAFVKVAPLVRKAFLGIQAIEPELGLTDTSIEIAHVKQAMIRAARRVILLADSSKWRRAAFVKVAPLSAIHTVVTDSDLPDDARAAFEHVGVEVIVV